MKEMTTNPIFEEQKRAYWQSRDELLKRYPHQWVAIANGVVVASGDSATKVMLDAYRKTGSKVLYINKVGDEERVMRKRIRRYVSGHYDFSYDPPIPMAEVQALSLDGERGAKVDFILDTGADITVLREDMGEALKVREFPVAEAKVGGLGNRWETRNLYGLLIELTNYIVATMIDCRDDVQENILGRDVMNEFKITLDGINMRVEIQGP
ncbi:MAG: DUF5678 domain-containing protein [Chloroflexota bacterium]|nr:DUF5678 domain-containing protein [Chloroflexota bacterium]